MNYGHREFAEIPVSRKISVAQALARVFLTSMASGENHTG
jgi:hypothetical protein